jgi:hypothetical protein
MTAFRLIFETTAHGLKDYRGKNYCMQKDIIVYVSILLQAICAIDRNLNGNNEYFGHLWWLLHIKS